MFCAHSRWYVVYSHSLCRMWSLVLFNVTLFWLIQECKGALPEMPPGTGRLVWLWRNLWNLPGTAATIPLSMLLCNLMLCHFKKNGVQPVLQPSIKTADCFKNQTCSYISAHFPKRFDQETEDAYRRWASPKEFEIQFVLLTIKMHQLQQGYV